MYKRQPHLSIRHLAWDPVSNTLGIALQAEHPDQAAHQAAPVLAVWDGRTLRAAEGQPALAGYGGDICALPRGGFAVSCPRVNQLALFGAQGQWHTAIEHVEAYALASDREQWWLASSRGQVGLLHGGTDGTDGAEPSRSRAPDRDTLAVQIENHWVLMVG